MGRADPSIQFGFYGLVRISLVEPLVGFCVKKSLLLTPLALGYLAFVVLQGSAVAFQGHGLLAPLSHPDRRNHRRAAHLVRGGSAAPELSTVGAAILGAVADNSPSVCLSIRKGLGALTRLRIFRHPWVGAGDLHACRR